MDRVKLGRALGYGTKHAAKTLAAVAEAAIAPSARTNSAPTNQEQPTHEPVQAAASSAVRSTPRVAVPSPARRTLPSVAQVRGAGRSVWGPLATFSGALWLRVTGLFFGLIALAMASGAWRVRGAVQAAGPTSREGWHLYLFVGFAALFAYFAVSSFVRASRRERRG